MSDNEQQNLQNKNDLLSQMDRLISSKLNAFEQRMESTQRNLSQSQISAIQEKLSASDNFTFRKKVNEEQFKVNSQVLNKMQEAAGHIQDTSRDNTGEAALMAHSKISEGIDILSHRQKLVRSEHGWKVVQEYEANPLADDSEDEKKIYRAQMKAERKVKQDRRFRGRRFRPYGFPTATVTSDSTTSPPQGHYQGTQKQGRYQGNKRPGNCFRCGSQGHWRKDCQAVIPDGQADNNTKISIATSSFSVSQGGPEDENSEVRSTRILQKSIRNDIPIVSPVGKLKARASHWKNAGASEYIFDVICNGYKLPFRQMPEAAVLKNNKSAIDNSDFVCSEISSLLSKQCISEVSYIPRVVNPLTVAFNRAGKKRLVLDCRHINPDLFKYKCCFEDHSVARQLFNQGDFLFSFDIRSAYHHCMVFSSHRTYLGFSWKINGVTKYYVFNVLPFGICTAGHIFTKLLKVPLKKWRSQGQKVVLFLDDGLGGNISYNEALISSRYIKQYLLDFGFLIADEKCQWTPTQTIVWMGYLWNSESGKLQVTNERICRTECLLNDLITKVTGGKVILPVRIIACIIGQLISMQSAVGHLVRLRTRALYDCVQTRASWEAPVMVSSKALEELIFWKENLRSLNESSFSDALVMDKSIFLDASGTGFGGYIAGIPDSEVVGSWSETESMLSSTWRELESVYRFVHSSVDSLEGQTVLVNTDNKNVCCILQVGSKKPYLQDIALNVSSLCKENHITLMPKWIPRSKNLEADFLSRCSDSDDWSVLDFVFSTAEARWGNHTFDRFACDYNTKCKLFNSRHWCPGTISIDAFAQVWKGENNWLVPPPRLITRCIRKVLKEECTCTIIIPQWRSAPFWPLLFPNGEKMASYVTDVFYFQPGVLTRRGRGRNCIFDGRPLTFGLVAVRIN